MVNLDHFAQVLRPVNFGIAMIRISLASSSVVQNGAASTVTTVWTASLGTAQLLPQSDGPLSAVTTVI